MGRPAKYKVGDQLGMWTIISVQANVPSDQRYTCKCVCGTIRNVRISAGNYIGSCGCKRGELLRAGYAEKRGRGIFNWARKHGLSQTREYRSWKHAINRCHNPKNDSYRLYGGRGIKVWDGWHGDEGFRRFLEYMGPRAEGTSLDRIDPNGDYEPGNCRWADDKTQIANRRTVVQVSLDRLRKLEKIAKDAGYEI